MVFYFKLVLLLQCLSYHGVIGFTGKLEEQLVNLPDPGNHVIFIYSRILGEVSQVVVETYSAQIQSSINSVSVFAADAFGNKGESVYFELVQVTLLSRTER